MSFNETVENIERIANRLKAEQHPNYIYTQLVGNELMEEVKELKKYMRMEG